MSTTLLHSSDTHNNTVNQDPVTQLNLSLVYFPSVTPNDVQSINQNLVRNVIENPTYRYQIPDDSLWNLLRKSTPHWSPLYGGKKPYKNNPQQSLGYVIAQLAYDRGMLSWYVWNGNNFWHEIAQKSQQVGGAAAPFIYACFHDFATPDKLREITPHKGTTPAAECVANLGRTHIHGVFNIIHPETSPIVFDLAKLLGDKTKAIKFKDNLDRLYTHLNDMTSPAAREIHRARQEYRRQLKALKDRNRLSNFYEQKLALNDYNESNANNDRNNEHISPHAETAEAASPHLDAQDQYNQERDHQYSQTHDRYDTQTSYRHNAQTRRSTPNTRLTGQPQGIRKQAKIPRSHERRHLQPVRFLPSIYELYPTGELPPIHEYRQYTEPLPPIHDALQLVQPANDIQVHYNQLREQ